jgi:hypothetical protein
MKIWNWILVTIFLLAGGRLYVSAQDMIVLKDGNLIEAQVMEITPSEIRYKRFDHLDGPTILVPAANVLSIRYENGSYEVINAMPQQPDTQTEKPTAIDPHKFIFGISANAGGAIGYAFGGHTGGGLTIELGKGRFNSEIHLMLPLGGFGVLFTFNGFWPSRIGGFYLGGGFGYSNCYSSHSGTIGFNIGYKFVTRSGLYFLTGCFVGFDFSYLFNGSIPVYSKPDLAIGWTMK